MKQTQDTHAFEWMQQAVSYSLEKFLKEYPHPFLVAQIHDEGNEEEFFTRLRPSSRPSDVSTLVRHAVHPSAIVLPVVKRQRNPYADMVTLGRAENCDIVLRYAGVSKFHAFIEVGGADQGRYTVVDAGSRNGTFLNERRLKSREPALLSSFDRLALGASVSLVFYLASDFFDALRGRSSGG